MQEGRRRFPVVPKSQYTDCPGCREGFRPKGKTSTSFGSEKRTRPSKASPQERKVPSTYCRKSTKNPLPPSSLPLLREVLVDSFDFIILIVETWVLRPEWETRNKTVEREEKSGCSLECDRRLKGAKG